MGSDNHVALRLGGANGTESVREGSQEPAVSPQAAEQGAAGEPQDSAQAGGRIE